MVIGSYVSKRELRKCETGGNGVQRNVRLGGDVEMLVAFDIARIRCREVGKLINNLIQDTIAKSSGILGDVYSR